MLVRTMLRTERPRRAITRNSSPDVPFDRSLNPYRGCEHGCIYCFARPSHAWLGMSAGLDFESRLIARPGIGAVLVRELGRGSYRSGVLATGTNTDPYQPVERDLALLSEMAGQGLRSWIMLRLPREVAPLFRAWLTDHHPDRAARVTVRLREMHGGQDYRADWGRRMRGEGPYAELIAGRFRLAVKRLRLATGLPGLRTDLFRVPPKSGDQLELF